MKINTKTECEKFYEAYLVLKTQIYPEVKKHHLQFRRIEDAAYKSCGEDGKEYLFSNYVGVVEGFEITKIEKDFLSLHLDLGNHKKVAIDFPFSEEDRAACVRKFKELKDAEVKTLIECEREKRLKKMTKIEASLLKHKKELEELSKRESTRETETRSVIVKK